MIIVSQAAYLLLPASSIDYPLIGYDNLVTAANIAAGTSAAGFPALNLANPATYLYWKANDLTAQSLTITLTGNTQLLDYVAFAKHNLYTAGVQIRIRGNTGAGLVDIVPWFTPGSNDALVVRFAKASYIAISIDFSIATTAVRCAVVYCGTLLMLQRKLYVGHKPITINSDSEIVSGYSENGNFLGRIIVNESRSTSIELQNLTPDWVRVSLKPFLIASKTRPFFFAWRPDSYPTEVGFTWCKGDPMPTNQRSNGMMQVSLNIGGIE